MKQLLYAAALAVAAGIGAQAQAAHSHASGSVTGYTFSVRNVTTGETKPLQMIALASIDASSRTVMDDPAYDDAKSVSDAPAAVTGRNPHGALGRSREGAIAHVSDWGDMWVDGYLPGHKSGRVHAEVVTVFAGLYEPDAFLLDPGWEVTFQVDYAARATLLDHPTPTGEPYQTGLLLLASATVACDFACSIAPSHEVAGIEDGWYPHGSFEEQGQLTVRFTNTSDQVLRYRTTLAMEMQMIQPAPIPEPSTYALLAVGLVGLTAVRRRRSS